MIEDTRKPPEDERYTPDPSIFKAIEAILKGLEVPLSNGLCFINEYGDCRKEVRSRWWDAGAGTYRKATMCKDDLLIQLPMTCFPSEAIRAKGKDRIWSLSHFNSAGAQRSHLIWITYDLIAAVHQIAELNVRYLC